MSDYSSTMHTYILHVVKVDLETLAMCGVMWHVLSNFSNNHAFVTEEKRQEQFLGCRDNQTLE